MLSCPQAAPYRSSEFPRSRYQRVEAIVMQLLPSYGALADRRSQWSASGTELSRRNFLHAGTW
jgi:hypothetical protein